MRQKLDFRLIVGAVLIVIAITVWWIYYSLFIFHITKVDPGNSRLPTSQNILEISFNKQLAQNQKATDKLSVLPAVPFDASINDKTLRINLRQTYVKDTRVEIRINNLVADNGDTFSKTLYFDVEYVPFGNLSEDQQEQQIKESDGFESSYPLIRKLPLITKDYEIDFRLPSNNQTKVPIVITTTTIVTSNPLADQSSPEYLELLRITRRDAISWLKQSGYNDELYELYFTEPQLVGEFGGKFIDELSPEDYGD